MTSPVSWWPIVRWGLMVPLAIVAWVAVAAAGIAVYSGIEGAQGPPEMMLSEMRTDPRVIALEKQVMHAFVALSAFVVVWVAVLVAPSHRRLVAVATYGAGLLVALLFALGGAAGLTLFAAAAAGGAIALVMVLAVSAWRRRAARR